jgi:hypothetical protein
MMSSAQCENEATKSQYRHYSPFAPQYMTNFFRDFNSGKYKTPCLRQDRSVLDRSGRLPGRPDRKPWVRLSTQNENRYIFIATEMLLI